MAFQLRIATANEAFRDGNRDQEIVRLLREIADQIERRPGVMSTILDRDGSCVGQWRFTIKDR